MADQRPSSNDSNGPRDSKGWDGKLRVVKDPETNGDVENGTSPPESDEENTNGVEEKQPTARITEVVNVPGYKIDADEDLLADVPIDETDIDLNHSRITSLPALRLERFTKLNRLCFRQNEISHIDFPSGWESASTLEELDLYDNAISHIRGLEELTHLTSLDLSFNNIKHIKKLGHLKKLKEIYFVQNKVGKIEGLDELTELTNLELGANRIREIENLDKLTKITELWLGKNKITELKNLSHLHNLTLLSIQSNRLTASSLSHLSTLPNLTELYLSHNAIHTLTPLSSCTNLTILDVSSNPITTLAGLASLTRLEELWASNCQLESFEEITSELGKIESLETVYFEGNPLETRQRVLYRNKVRLALPNIKKIDATYVRAT